MAGLEGIDVALASLSRAFCSPLARFVQIQVPKFSVEFVCFSQDLHLYPAKFMNSNLYFLLLSFGIRSNNSFLSKIMFSWNSMHRYFSTLEEHTLFAYFASTCGVFLD